MATDQKNKKKTRELGVQRLDTIQSSVDRLTGSIPPISKQVFKRTIQALSGLDKTEDGRIKATISNIKEVKKLKPKIREIILNPTYKKEVAVYTKTIDKVAKNQNASARIQSQ